MREITIDLDLLKTIMDSESKKLVGKVCKRFEVCEDKDQIKKEVKELIYEFGRDLKDFFTNGQILFTNQDKQSKE
jgi:hypothetical protein